MYTYMYIYIYLYIYICIHIYVSLSLSLCLSLSHPFKRSFDHLQVGRNVTVFEQMGSAWPVWSLLRRVEAALVLGKFLGPPEDNV